MNPIPAISNLPAIFGNMDIYLFDQLLKGNIKQGMKVLDAGCGNGRNCKYLLQAGVEMYGADTSENAILDVQKLAQSINPVLPASNFVVADLAALPYTSGYFDVVICSAVLHFSKSEAHFRSIVQEVWRTLKPGGLLFCRFSTTIGLEGKLQLVNDRFYRMPHGPIWFLADEAILTALEKELKATRTEPLKTIIVEQNRSMTTWVLRK